MTRITKFGRFTIAEVKNEEKKLTGIGIARKSENDKYNERIAEKIAMGRAEKALKLKLEGKFITNLFMG
jgi:hypothetical protein